MYNQRQIYSILDGTYKLIGSNRIEYSCHILNAYGADAHGCKLLGHNYILIQGMNRARSIGNSSRCHSSVLKCFINSYLEIIKVIKCIKDTNDINAVFYRCPYKASYYIVRIMLIAQYILTSEQHLKLGVRHSLAQLPESLPRILVKVS